MELREFIDEFAEGDAETSLSIVNSEQPPMIARMVNSLFEEQTVDVSEAARVLSDSDVVELRRDGTVVSQSAFSDVRDSVLAVNSDLYITGSRPLKAVETPAVIRDLEGIKFSVRGYPAGTKGKLLLIEISRYIEAKALRHGEGELHTGFQRLSRIVDERGTERAYETLSETDLDVHVYGIGDADALSSHDVTVHNQDVAELRSGWFVVFAPPTDSDATGAALIAFTDDNVEWDGIWVIDTEAARRVAAYLSAEYGAE
ncbi:DICT sensory domain-containing protein [Halobellus captivus]|uniref:DICT sensory domain-containing protein n=1 Tax=Halobellus captivus TaxID=2592614 RepID=UPI0011A0CED2|nr:DICT sensory domain-containing protein [Halobellus captivus]